MKEDLKEAIAEWENGAVYDSRKVSATKANNGEYVLTVSEAADLAYEGHVKNVVEYSLYLTRAQSTTSRYSSNGDVYLFKKIASAVEDRFLNKCSEVLKKIIKEIEDKVDPEDTEDE